MKQETYQDHEPFYDKKNDDTYLSNWVFHFNSFSGKWAAIPRDEYSDYWNNYESKSVLRSKHLNTLLDLLHKTKGNVELIDDLIHGEVK